MCGSILSKLVPGRPSVFLRQRLICPAVPRQKTWSNNTYVYCLEDESVTVPRQQGKHSPYSYSCRPSENTCQPCAIKTSSYRTNLVLWDCECMRVRPISTLSTDICAVTFQNAPRTSPCHSECSEVRDLQRLGDVVATHRARTLDEDVCALTRFPGRLKKVVYPSAELSQA